MNRISILSTEQSTTRTTLVGHAVLKLVSTYVYYDSILKVHTTRMFWQIIFEYVNAKTVTD